MKKNTKIVAALIAVGLVSPMAYATNGDQMMAVGSQNTALGGTGVANFTGADSIWANSAMLGKSKGDEVTGGVVMFDANVANTGMPGGTSSDSSAAVSYIPDVSYSSRLSDSLTYGVALAGIAGMGVDYSGATASTHISAKSALSILRVIPTIAYNQADYGVGFSPVFQSGSLMLSYNNPAGAAVNTGEKKESDSGYGYSFGGYYNVSSALTVAASYQSEIAAKYGTQISDAGNGFGVCAGGTLGAAGCQNTTPFGDDLNQPAEIKAGVAYTMDSITLTADYKQIKWGSAAGYKDFNWKDQTIAAIGAKYAGNGYWLGLGYNSGNDPISANTVAAGTSAAYREHAINFFNNMFFPAVVTNSYTFGGGYDISKAMAIEAAAVITPKVTKVVDVASFAGTSGITTNTTTHSQSAYSVSLRYKF